MPTDRPRRVLVVDDHRSFAESIAVVIDSIDGLSCVGTAASGAEAVERCLADPPDVVVMDVDMPDMDGVDAARQITAAQPDIRIVVLTGAADGATLGRAAGAGATAFLLKDAAVTDIVEAIRSAGERTTMGVDADVVSQLLGSSDAAPAPDLTYRELEVLGLLSQGRQPKEIAHQLGITVHTCRGYVKNILAALGCHSALEAVVEAHRRGIVRLPSDG